MRLRRLLARLIPSRRSLAIGCAILGCAVGAYVLARETSLFAISRIEVTGGSPRLAAQVRRALAPLVGTSLVGLDGAHVLRSVDALPTVASASYDRAFPSTLRIDVVPERPAAVLRRGVGSWLVSGSGRVIGPLPAHADPRLPRIWLAAQTPVQTGGELDTTPAVTAARAVGLAGTFATRIAVAADANGSLVFHLRSGLTLVLGDAADVPLKVGVAERALPALPTGSTFLDVSVPGRPVAGAGSPVGAASPAGQPKGSSRG